MMANLNADDQGDACLEASRTAVSPMLDPTCPSARKARRGTRAVATWRATI